jgi:hypothetical protein
MSGFSERYSEIGGYGRFTDASFTARNANNF